MTTPREFFTFSCSFALLVGAACTQPVATQIPLSDGWGPGGGGPKSPGQGSGATSSSGSSSGAKPSSSGSGSGGVSSGSGGYDAGGYGKTDAGGGGYDAGSTLEGGGAQNAGSCQSPHCATDTNECGCQATDSNGAQVLLGCQAGGDCVCIVNGNVDGQPFPEDGACADQQSTEAQFLTNCSCQ